MKYPERLEKCLEELEQEHRNREVMMEFLVSTFSDAHGHARNESLEQYARARKEWVTLASMIHTAKDMISRNSQEDRSGQTQFSTDPLSSG